MSEELKNKLESLISGYRINSDDADWLRALESRPAPAVQVPEDMVMASRKLIGDAIDRANFSLPGWEAHVSALTDALAPAEPVAGRKD